MFASDPGTYNQKGINHVTHIATAHSDTGCPAAPRFPAMVQTPPDMGRLNRHHITEVAALVSLGCFSVEGGFTHRRLRSSISVQFVTVRVSIHTFDP